MSNKEIESYLKTLDEGLAEAEKTCFKKKPIEVKPLSTAKMTALLSIFLQRISLLLTLNSNDH